MLEAAHRGEIDSLYSLGGNLLETMPDRAYMREALARVKLRVHQDIVLNTSSLLEGETVILLPAETRYETAGGGTATSTERRIRYTHEIHGPRIAEARAEWDPGAAGAGHAPRARGVVPVARHRRHPRRDGPGDADLRRHRVTRARGPVGAVGRARLYADGFTKMPEGRARFTSVTIPRS
jgi:hypothetical protein